jgi:glycosyltransferase involved in cell wall biosynthesis
VVDAAARFPNASFRIVGAGRHGFEKIVQQKITQLGLTNVSLDGPRTQTQMLDIMRTSDIFLLPSRLEGIPKVTLEASATGLPCIVFDDYETPSVVDGETGFQARTIEEMMQALEKLIEDCSLRERMGSAARSHVRIYDWDIVARKWQSAYLEIAGIPVK